MKPVCYFPEGKKAAVSFSYDDGAVSQLTYAVPQLEAAGVRGTFYQITSAGHFLEKIDLWKAAAARGHEMGNHTVHHRDRVSKDNSYVGLDAMTEADIRREVHEANAWLDTTFGKDPARSFAYPFAYAAIGTPPDEAPYTRAILEVNACARLGGSSAPNDPATVEPARVRSFSFGNPSLAQLQDYCLQAEAMGGWTVLTFHGVGGDWISTDERIHEALLTWLSQRSIWVAPVCEVWAKIAQARGLT